MQFRGEGKHCLFYEVFNTTYVKLSKYKLYIAGGAPSKMGGARSKTHVENIRIRQLIPTNKSLTAWNEKDAKQAEWSRSTMEKSQ